MRSRKYLKITFPVNHHSSIQMHDQPRHVMIILDPQRVMCKVDLHKEPYREIEDQTVFHCLEL